MILRRLPSWPMAFGELEVMRRGMERLYESLAESSGLPAAGVYPAVNLFERPDAVILRAELPGIHADDLDITMENDTLTIAGERAMPAEDDQVSYHRREREWGKFRRGLSIPVHVDPNNVQARYVDGILTVTLAKAQAARPRRIAVQAEA